MAYISLLSALPINPPQLILEWCAAPWSLYKAPSPTPPQFLHLAGSFIWHEGTTFSKQLFVPVLRVLVDTTPNQK